MRRNVLVISADKVAVRAYRPVSGVRSLEARTVSPISPKGIASSALETEQNERWFGREQLCYVRSPISQFLRLEEVFCLLGTQLRVRVRVDQVRAECEKPGLGPPRTPLSASATTRLGGRRLLTSLERR